MSALPPGFTVRTIPYRTAPDDDLAALHLIETEVESEKRPERAPQPLDNFIGFARSLPVLFTDWTWLVESADGTPVASGACWYREGGDPRNFESDVLVRRVWRRNGIGSQLLGRICDTADQEQRAVLLGWTSNGAPDGEAFMRHMGARAGRVNRTSELQLSELDWPMVERWAEEGPGRAPGYSLDPVDGPLPAELYDDAVIFHDIMETQPHDDLDVAEWRMTPDQIAQFDHHMVESGQERWTIFVRDPSGACVGGTDVHFAPWEPLTVFQGNTGIDPEHRGRGLGKWVKAAMLLRVRRERPTAERVQTGNAYSNAPMLAINDALGFTVIRTLTDWQLDVAEARVALQRSSA